MAYGFNTGQDCTIDLVDSNGVAYSFSTIGGDLLHFEADWDLDVIRRRPISGKGLVKRRIDFKGTKGTIEIGRVNADFERIMIAAQDRYRNGQDPVTYTIHQLVQNRDNTGTQSAFRFTNCTIWISKGASYTMGEDVKLTIEFEGDDVKQDR